MLTTKWLTFHIWYLKAFSWMKTLEFKITLEKRKCWPECFCPGLTSAKQWINTIYKDMISYVLCMAKCGFVNFLVNIKLNLARLVLIQKSMSQKLKKQIWKYVGSFFKLNYKQLLTCKSDKVYIVLMVSAPDFTHTHIYIHIPLYLIK